jgi:hypothetical protein
MSIFYQALNSRDFRIPIHQLVTKNSHPITSALDYAQCKIKALTYHNDHQWGFMTPISTILYKPYFVGTLLLTLIGWTGEGLLVMSAVSGDGVWKKAVLCCWRADSALACSNDTRNQPNPPSLRENQQFHKLLFAKVHAHGEDNIWKLDLM